MACERCRSLDLDRLLNEVVVPHHSTFKELKACASAGYCLLCEWITYGLEDSFEQRGDSLKDFDETNVYYYASGETEKIEDCRGISGVMFIASLRRGRNFYRYTTIVELFVGRGNCLRCVKMQ